MKRKHEEQIIGQQLRTDSGSALILTVVLTSLLAVIGVMFIMVARVDKISTSAIIENKELNLAVDSVIAKISEQLILDTPGAADPNQEYYDYPDPCNPWLASLEPYEFAPGNYRWRHISDIYDVIDPSTEDKIGLLQLLLTLGLFDTDDEQVGPYNLKALPVSPSDEITGAYDPDEVLPPVAFGGPADADGDGVADSRWVQLPDATGSKGEPIFAAVRIIDNSAMLNVNTAYKFDPNTAASAADIDGSRLAQIHMLDFVKGVTDNVYDLHLLRCGGSLPDLVTFNDECAVRIENPDRTTINYLPYDISDELELRNRYLLDVQQNTTRIELALPITLTYPAGKTFGNRIKPIDSNTELDKWKTILNPFDPNDMYNFRHLLTTYNIDRLIDPNGNKMLNINTAGAFDIYNKLLAIRNADPNSFLITDAEAAQIAVNIKDYIDGNDPNLSSSHFDPYNEVSSLFGKYYGFERPCIYISELAHKFTYYAVSGEHWWSYAIELHKPYIEDGDPVNWQLVIDNPPRTIPITWSGTEQFHVIAWQHPSAPLDVNFMEIGPTAQSYDNSASDIIFQANSKIHLQRPVDGTFITVDSIDCSSVPSSPLSRWLAEDANEHSFQRDITRHKCIRRLWDNSLSNLDFPTLGRANGFVDTVNTQMIQAHPANTAFTNIGEIGMVFRRDPNTIGPNTIGPSDTEASVRIDLTDYVFQQLFKYLTVFDPASDDIDNDGDGQIDDFDISAPEWKVPGRININTAPWYVIAQLPWVSYHTPNFDLARAIVDYRDNTFVGFDNIGQLNNLIIDPNNYRRIDYYALDANDLSGYPDLTPDDGVGYDFEERDVIFSRISNLVTVRSDVFTAYILVRIGTDGPQKRVIAILDRSDVYSPTDKVKIIALHPVPDPR